MSFLRDVSVYCLYIFFHEYKYLGVVFDDKLEWHSHADKITKKTRNNVFIVTNTARPIGYIRCGHIVL